ncbi:cation:proton antiporter regulatory subunit [Haladaptatus pallidirubidus]|uniref:cation:proton antiporter regulatory subunit n=1 Tax=Haladaptatus pallidirubidus TaxID=1008152 RepID=UPI001D12D1CB|nr:TrkA C-terminal domain-containing protein [Haladaptatus pallidirubidus]
MRFAHTGAATVGQTVGDALVRSKTGCTVVGVERDGDVITDIGLESSIESEDELIIAGTDEDIYHFNELMG